MALDKESFKTRLEETHIFPSLYMFKFIVPKEQINEVESLFPKNEFTEKSSSGGKYISITAKVMVSSADQIIEIYESAQKIEGIIAL